MGMPLTNNFYGLQYHYQIKGFALSTGNRTAFFKSS